MNLVEALNAALPELPSRTARKTFPKLDPTLIAREHVEEGAPTVIAMIPGSTMMYRFTPEQWKLIQLFDGESSYQDVADAYFGLTGVSMSEDDMREFAAGLESEDFWYRTPLEKNVALTQKLDKHRQQLAKKRFKFGDVSHMQFSAWDPDKALDKVYAKMKWVYSRWFTILTLCLFAFMVYVFIDRWSEIGSDTLRFYNFTEKSFWDIVEFWLLFLVIAFCHECAHGITVKHCGGGVRRMGFHLIYLTPAFFVDVAQAWVYAGRWHRIMTMMAGIWMEMIFCGVATVMWWGTSPGTPVHEFAYTIMLFTGVAVILINLNPLIKLDGYFVFTELIGIADVKERSTAFVSTWVRKNIFRLPVEVEWVSRRHRRYFVPYALLSGAYSYGLLLMVNRLAYNALFNFFGEWAFIPSAALFLTIFKSRIRTLGRFMQILYLDKREMLREWFTPPRLAAVCALVLIFMFAPLWRKEVDGRFLLEPGARAEIRTAVPGTVQEVFADEGQPIQTGSTVAILRNLQLESEVARSEAEFRVAAARATQAQLRYVDYGPAERDRQQAYEHYNQLRDKLSRLQLKSPITGVVVTPRAHDRVGAYVNEGTVLAEVADLSLMRARIYLPEFAVRDAHDGAMITFHFDGMFAGRRSKLSSISPVSVDIEPGLMHKQEFKGMRASGYYVVTAVIPNPDGVLKEGMSGTAKIFAERRSLVHAGWEVVTHFVGRKVW